jgi:hypothetical protein
MTTATGRKESNPHLQNIPIKTKTGRIISDFLRGHEINTGIPCPICTKKHPDGVSEYHYRITGKPNIPKEQTIIVPTWMYPYPNDVRLVGYPTDPTHLEQIDQLRNYIYPERKTN